jgi:hypothetical protein
MERHGTSRFALILSQQLGCVWVASNFIQNANAIREAFAAGLKANVAKI